MWSPRFQPHLRSDMSRVRRPAVSMKRNDETGLWVSRLEVDRKTIGRRIHGVKPRSCALGDDPSTKQGSRKSLEVSAFEKGLVGTVVGLGILRRHRAAYTQIREMPT